MGKSFFYLNLTQFLDSLNENFFKYVVIYFLIFYQGKENSSAVMSITGGVFVLPFILFSSFGGVLADLYSKTKIIQITRILQLVIVCIALVMVIFPMGSWIYPILFLMASLAALFGPSKYGIIPEITEEKHLVKANAYVAAFTFFGIIFGTTLASFLLTLTRETFSLMMLASIGISILGIFFSRLISQKKSAFPDKKWPKFVYREIYDALLDMKKKPLMLTALFAYSYFLFIAAYVQMNLVPYSITNLNMNAALGGYLFFFSSIGIGIGSLLVSKTSGSLKLLPMSSLGISLGCFLFSWISHPIWINVIWLMGLGVFAGMFLVPSQTFILAHSNPENKGRNFSVANFFSFAAALVAAAFLYLVQEIVGLNPGRSFAWVATLNLGVALFLFFKIYRSPYTA